MRYYYYGLKGIGKFGEVHKSYDKTSYERMTPVSQYTTRNVPNYIQCDSIYLPQRTSYLLLLGLYGGISNEFSSLARRGANFVLRVDFRVASIGGLRCTTGVEGHRSGTFV